MNLNTQCVIKEKNKTMIKIYKNSRTTWESLGWEDEDEDDEEEDDEDDEEQQQQQQQQHGDTVCRH